MNEVNARRVRLVLGWVTVLGRVYTISVCNKPTRSTQALHPGVAKSSTSFGWGKRGDVSSVGWQVTL